MITASLVIILHFINYRCIKVVMGVVGVTNDLTGPISIHHFLL